MLPDAIRRQAKAQGWSAALLGRSGCNLLPDIEVSRGTKMHCQQQGAPMRAGWKTGEWHRIVGMTHPPHSSILIGISQRKRWVVSDKEVRLFLEKKKNKAKTHKNDAVTKLVNIRKSKTRLSTALCQSHCFTRAPQPLCSPALELQGSGATPTPQAQPCISDIHSTNHSLHLVQAEDWGSETYRYHLNQPSNPTNSSNSLWKYHPRSIKIQIWDAAHRD